MAGAGYASRAANVITAARPLPGDLRQALRATLTGQALGARS
jgi:hypothetical protein